MVTKKVGTQKAGTAKVTGQAARQATAKVVKATTKAATSRGAKSAGAAAKQVAQTLYAVALERAKEAVGKPKVKTSEDAQNAIFGPGGALRGLFPTEAERKEFSRSETWAEIQRLIDAFPQSENVLATAESVNGRILVRVPKSVHAELLNEAKREGCSLNQLCVAKLSRPLGSEDMSIRPAQAQN